ncbi:hypothetical protein RQP46_003152 [Phenoliferia psychrophenolica]
MKLSIVLALVATASAFPHMLRDLGVDLSEFEAIAKREGPRAPRAIRALKSRQSQYPASVNLPAITVPGLNVPNVINIPGVITVGAKNAPHNGIISAGDILYACTEMLGYSMDLAEVLVALAIRSGTMDVTTLLMSIGGKDARTNGPGSTVLGAVPGLFDETDGSMAYDDEWFHRTNPVNAGSHFNGTRWAELQAVADQNGGLFDIDFHSTNKFLGYK